MQSKLDFVNIAIQERSFLKGFFYAITQDGSRTNNARHIIIEQSNQHSYHGFKSDLNNIASDFSHVLKKL